MILARGAKRFHERRVEQITEPPADRRLPCDAVEILERAVPANDLLVGIEDDEAVVERLEDVLVELAHPPELFGFQVQLAVEPAVFDRRGDLAGNRRKHPEIFTVEGLVGLLAAQREDGDGATLE